ncbi:BTAD domain-containing putative transcriptional regulator [Rhodococcus sp. NPDC003318]|uniref:BTAD domain-containing putative transcriptional regulator n=1 Tax=Rhodococcus sp. NPDC003318 TaxID=3364503 RepID=UPI003688B015
MEVTPQQPGTDVTVHVLGSVRARVAGAPVDLGGPSRRAVLARLVAAHGTVVSTDLLIDDLWSGDAPPKALAALQVHISYLRRILEPARRPRTAARVLVSATPGYALVLPDTAVDSWQFEALVGRGQGTQDPASRAAFFDRALDLWTGPPFQELADTAWTRPEVERLQELRRTAIEESAKSRLAQGDPESAVALLGRHVADHPDRETATALLALAQYRSGRQAEALTTLRAARRHLADELGVDPGPQLQELERDILTHAPALAPQALRIPEPQRPDGPSNARPAELATLLAEADLAVRSGLRVVWLGGEAGAGKSTLTAHLVAALTGRGWSAAWGRCPEVDGAPPGWPWGEVLRDLRERHPMDPATSGQLANLLGEEGADGTMPGPFWLAQGLPPYLSAVSQRAPLVIALDDAHRADELTLQLLRHVAVHASGAPILVVATFRERSPELAAAWSATAGVPGARVELGPLSNSGVDEIVREAGLGALAAPVLAHLTERSGGNPLFVKEFARLVQSEGETSVDRAVPDGVRDLLRRRVERLPDPTVSTLRRAAVLGREFDLTVLRDLGDLTEDALVDALEPALGANVLVESGPDRLRFAHILIRDVVYADLPGIRRTRLHAAALEVLAERTPDDVAVLARHAIAARAPAAAAVEYVVRAARRADAVFSHREAVELWAAALDLLERSADADERALVDILIPYVGALARTGDIVSARRHRQSAIDVAARVEDRVVLIRALTSWTAPVTWYIRTDSAVDEAVLGPIETMLARPGLSGRDRALLLVAKAFELEENDPDAVTAAVREALALARESGDPVILRRALNAYGYVAYGPDFADERRAIAEELLAVATGDPGFQAQAHFQLFMAAAADGDLGEALDQVAEAVEYAAGNQLSQMLGALDTFRGLADLIAGEIDSALECYDAAAARLAEAGTGNADWLRVIGRIGAGVVTGDLAGIAPELLAIEKAWPQSLRPAVVLALLDVGDPEQARRLWDGLADPPRDHFWLTMTTLRGRAAVRLGDVAVAERCRVELAPYTGRFAGPESGSVYAGPVDAALAELAEFFGDAAGAAHHRGEAEKLIERTRAYLRVRRR